MSYTTAQILATNKTCSKCQVLKLVIEFSNCAKTLDGLQRWCNDCMREVKQTPKARTVQRQYGRRQRQLPKIKEYQSAWHKTKKAKEAKKRYNARPENKEKTSSLNLMKKYGITLEDKKRMFEEQKGKCALKSCPYIFKSISDAHLDHCHTTGKIRGLLCVYCNHGLGLFKDNPNILLEAASYTALRGIY